MLVCTHARESACVRPRPRCALGTDGVRGRVAPRLVIGFKALSSPPGIWDLMK